MKDQTCFDIIRLKGSKVKAFGGSEITVFLSFSAVIKVMDAEKPIVYGKFMVVESNSHAILGRETAEALKVLKTGLEVNTLEMGDSDEVFPCIPNKLVHLNIDRTITPIQIPRVRIPVALEEPVKKRIAMMLRQQIIEKAPNTKSFVSPMNVVAKGRDDFRIVVDMREANKAIQRKYHPLPVMENLFQRLSGASLFTTLDLKSVYHQIQLHPESRDVTTFMSQQGAMRFTRLVFGMNAAPEIFQETIDSILEGCEGCIAYLDDILVFGNSLEELRARTSTVKERLRANNLILNIDKCHYEQNSVEFLGFKVDADGLHPTEEKIKLIDSFKVPTDLKELKSFLGCVTFLGSFIKDMATVVEPMRKLTRNGEIFRWEGEQEEAFARVKQILKNEIVTQAFFDNGREARLYTDASGVGLGAVLAQRQEDGTERTIMYASKSLTKAERAYPQIHREALAIIWAVEKFSHYLLGKEFTIVTDNNSLKQLYGSDYRDSKRTQMRFEGWHLRLAPFRFKIEHIPGKDNVAADTLSRMCKLEANPYVEEKTVLELGKISPQINTVWDEMQIKTISLNDIREETNKDVSLQAVIEAMNSGSWAGDAKIMKPFADEFFVKNGILMRGHQIVMPEKLRKQVLLNAHVGHSGVVVMKKTIRSRMWWPRLDKDVVAMVQKCVGCTAVARDDAPEPMERTCLPQRAMEFVAIDHWSASVITAKLLVVSDYYSRYLWVKRVKDTTSAESIKACQEIFKIFGKPVTLRTDNGTAFSSNEFREWTEAKDIKLDFSVPLWPQHNGQVENAMKYINKNLRIARVNQENWVIALDRAVEFYNNMRVHTTTGSTPAEMMFGRRLRGSLPLTNADPVLDDDDIRDIDTTEKSKGKDAADVRRHAKQSALKEGDIVFMRAKGGDKLSARFDTSKPCLVTEKEGATVEVKTSTGECFKRNVTAVKRSFAEMQNEPSNSEELRVIAETPGLEIFILST
jgi:transposase InsO family protein